MKRKHQSNISIAIVITFLLGLLPMPSVAQPETDALIRHSSKTAAYEQAQKNEAEQAAVLALARHLDDRAYAASETARRYQAEIKALQNDAQARNAAFTQVSTIAQQAEQAKRAALIAITANTQASTKALQTATAFANARGKQRARLAREADAAATRKNEAMQQSRAALEKAAQASNSLRYALASVGYRSAEFNTHLIEAQATADAFAEKSSAFVDAVATAKSKVSSPAMAAASAQMAERAVQLRDETHALNGHLKLVRDLADEMKLAQEQEPAHAAVLQAYFNAELNVAIEVDAVSYLAAVRKVSLQRCVNDSVCRASINQELALAEQQLASTRAEATERLGAATANIDTTRYIGRRMDEYADMSASNLQTLDTAVANAGAAQVMAEEVSKITGNDYQRALEGYAQAQQAADSAYLAAYGKPRYAAESTPKMAAPAPAPEPGATAAMMAPNWQIEAHAWEFFTATTNESKGYGAYTYVLFGRRVGSQLAPQVKLNYAALLNAIIASTPHISEVSPEIPHDKLNLFCIPGKTAWKEGLAALDESSDKLSALDNYASSLAFSTLSTAGSGAVRSREILDVIQDSPGPFLLTTLQPLRLVKSDSPMLFVDLSRFLPETYTDLVTAYKRALVERPPQGQQTWQPPTFQWIAATGTGVASHLVKVKNVVSAWLSVSEAKPLQAALH